MFDIDTGVFIAIAHYPPGYVGVEIKENRIDLDLGILRLEKVGVEKIAVVIGCEEVDCDWGVSKEY